MSQQSAENKKTFLLIEAMNISEGEEKKKLIQLMNEKNIRAEEKIKSVKTIFNNLNIQQRTKNEMLKHYNTAIESLHQISIAEKRKNVLHSFAGLIVQRDV